VTNNHHKYLDNRDSHTYLQFTIATGNFWKQRKNVARRGKRSVKGFILLLKTSGKANLSAQAGLRAKSDVFAFYILLVNCNHKIYTLSNFNYTQIIKLTIFLRSQVTFLCSINAASKSSGI
jgi:hypothetical protein